jgi:hypothetical protein
MATHDKVVASANGERELSMDRLTKIDGIAEKTAEALYEIGIHSCADLAEYLSQHTAQEVSEALKEQGVNRPPALIDRETWARQAEVFSQPENNPTALPQAETEPVQKPEEAPSSPEPGEHDAVFRVSFDIARDAEDQPTLQTTVYDEKNTGKEEVFQGSDPAPWVNWMLERANLPLALELVLTQAEVTMVPPPTGTESTAPPVPVGPYDAALKIGDVEVSVAGPSSETPEKRLKAEINFRLSGADAQTLASQGIPFRIEVYTVDLGSGVLELVASDQSQLESQVFEYRDQQKFAIPDVGRYEFHSRVLLLPPGEMVAYHRGPTIRVVP